MHPILADWRRLAAYLDEPDVSDGEVGRRSEQLTLVFDAGGTFEVPGVSLDWWNTAAERIETASVPPLTLTVAGPPPAGAEPESGPMARFRLLGILVAMLVVFALLLMRTQMMPQKMNNVGPTDSTRERNYDRDRLPSLD